MELYNNTSSLVDSVDQVLDSILSNKGMSQSLLAKLNHELLEAKTAMFRYSSTYTVIGFWPDSEQRFTDYTSASSGDEAEKKVMEEYPGLTVVCVIKGVHDPEDTSVYLNLNE